MRFWEVPLGYPFKDPKQKEITQTHLLAPLYYGEPLPLPKYFE
jgi:hypothetical protein